MVLVEGLIAFIIIAALLYVTPGTLGQVKTAAPTVCGDQNCANATGRVMDVALNTSVGTISTSVGGGLSLSGIAPIMLGIGLMIAGFAYIRNR